MKKTLIISLLLCMFSAGAAFADGVLKIRDQAGAYILPDRVEVRVELVDQVAVTRTKQYFTNKTKKSVKLHYGFPLGVNATATEFRWWQHGEMRIAQIAGKPQDTTITNPGPGGTNQQDKAFLDYLGESPFLFSFRDSLAADSSIIVELSYIELLKYSLAQVGYVYPLSRFNNEQFPFTLDFSLRSQRRLLDIASPSHTMSFVSTDSSAEGKYLTDSETLQKDFRIHYRLDQKDLGVFLLSNKPGGEDGFFIMLAEPDPKTSQEKVIDKIFTFIIDVSGSMSGTKMRQARDAAKYCIEHLNQADRFNIIAFSDQPRSFRDAPVSVTPANITAGLAYIDNLVANGGTNLQDAVIRGLVQDMPDTTANIIIFLTDGIAELDQQKVVNANTKNVRIFVFGIGADVNESLLKTMAEKNNGLSEFLRNDEVTSKVSVFYNKIRDPLLLSPAVEFSAGEVYETSPLRLPDLYAGEQLTMLGRYKVPGDAVAKLKGTAFGQNREYSYNVNFSGDSLINVFVPKMWAKSRIGDLLTLMGTVPENSNLWKEWRAEIVRLSVKYGLLTKFSSLEDPGTGNPTSVEEESAPEMMVVSALPNPFSERAEIVVNLPDGMEGSEISLRIFDAAGNFITEIFSGELHGRGSFTWSGTDASGARAANGAYLCRLMIGDRAYICRIVLSR